MTLYRNESLTDGQSSYYPSVAEARAAARVALQCGAPPFLRVAEPVEIPKSRGDLAAFLNRHSQPRAATVRASGKN